MMFKCHCRDCQQVTGGGFVAGLLVPASAFRLTKGQLRYQLSVHFTRPVANRRVLERKQGQSRYAPLPETPHAGGNWHRTPAPLGCGLHGYSLRTHQPFIADFGQFAPDRCAGF